VNEAWADIAVDGERTLVYGPRFGRLYLLHAGVARDPTFLRMSGLAASARADDLVDPVDRIACDLPALACTAKPVVPALLRATYGLMRASRRVTNLRVAARAVRHAAKAFGCRAVAPGASASEIGRLVWAVETGGRGGDCYARALLTAYLCLSSGRGCTLAVGVLSPTRKMHAWCGVDGVLPYEPFPEHYLYQPVWTLRLAP
jgi:hypothetical protein